eukprot:6972698-Prymnesium_polylepis.2
MAYVVPRVPAFTRSISHQWLGFAVPDPSDVHYHAICSAADELCRKHTMDKNELYLWIDYLSIPQRNPVMQHLSISTLPLYASISRFFIVVAPPVTTDEKGEVNKRTYQRRGWVCCCGSLNPNRTCEQKPKLVFTRVSRFPCSSVSA